MIQRQQIGPYRIIGRVGVGGMGTVMRARDEVRGREVALKIPNDVDPQSISVLQKEFEVLRLLEHHNIVQIYGSGSDADPKLAFYIVMEFVDGVTVEELLHQQRGRLETPRALKIAVGVADALTYAHTLPQRIVHRDIKPGNVMIRRSDDVVKVTDFGIAALLTEKAGRTNVGTLAYMAPEQATGKGVDERSDLYALGAMLYEMLTGQRSPQLASAPPRPPGAWLDGSLPQVMRARIDRLVMGLLQADRDLRRPQMAAQVAEELRAILENRPTRPVNVPSRPLAGPPAGNAALLSAPTQRATLLPSAAIYPPPVLPRPTAPAIYVNHPPPVVPVRAPAPPVQVPPPPPVRPPPRPPVYRPPVPRRAASATMSLLFGLAAAGVAAYILLSTNSLPAIRALSWPVQPSVMLSGSFPQGTLNHISFILLLACVVPALLALILGVAAASAMRRKRLRGGALAFFGRLLAVLSVLALALILLVAR